MFINPFVRALAIMVGLLLAAAVNAAPSVWFCEEIYSNSDGSVQFIMFSTDMSGQQFLAGQAITASSGNATHSYTFPNDLPADSANRRFLVATQGFADLHVLSPDYVVPNGFLFAPSGTINCIGNPYGGHTEASYSALPADGVNAYYPACDFETLPSQPSCVTQAQARNFAGHSYAFSAAPSPTSPPPVVPPPVMPPPVTPPPSATGSVPVIEYYHAAFDHYFITAIPDEIAKLDSGVFEGWARTGLHFNAYALAGPATSPVCRFFTTAFAPKSSHFHSPLAVECDKTKANADWTLETPAAFYVALPANDGSCAAGLTPIYRLYNNGQSDAPNHRYTSDSAVRAQMIARGWVPEGLGSDAVQMCAPS